MGFLTSAINQGRNYLKKRKNKSYSNTGGKPLYKKKVRSKPSTPVRYQSKYDKFKRKKLKYSNFNKYNYYKKDSAYGYNEEFAYT